MLELGQEYIEKLEEIAQDIQASDELAQYLESEEEEDFNRIKEQFEPHIALVYDEVAKKYPLQLIAFELVLLEPVFEGLYLPKILGYSVLRGEVSDHYKYVRPQDHFKEILLSICQSANFDLLKKRIGQTIQIGFALSSDIWVTNLINEVTNKRVRYFLQSQKLERYRRVNERKIGYQRYHKQFKTDVFMTAEFPTTLPELKVLFSPLKNFLVYRTSFQEDNQSLLPPLKAFLANPDFVGTPEHLEVMGLFGYYFDTDEEAEAMLLEQFSNARKKDPEFSEKFTAFMLELHENDELDLTPESDQKMSAFIDKSIKDELGAYYGLMDLVHDKGYLHEEVHEAIKLFCNRHEGLSPINECVRLTIYNYFARLINNLPTGAYSDFFEISRYFPVYMKIFGNQQFNQRLKELSMRFVRKLLKRYTDKRGKDYQDIKKFVSTNFLDFEFLKEKEIIELFKTRRKKKPA